MILYNKLPKRIAIKKIGGRYRFNKLLLASKLKPGDLISSCMGYNQRIKSIESEWTDYGCSKGEYVYDFNIDMINGGCCSIIHCCTFPTWTKEEVILFHEWWIQNKDTDCCRSKLIDAIRNGVDIKNVFNEYGEPYSEYI